MATFASLVESSAQVVAVACDALLSGVLAASLRIVDGSVTADSRRTYWRDCELQLAPDDDFTHAELYALLSTPGLELAPRRGFTAPDGSTLTVALGRFVVDEVEYVRGSGGTTLSVTGSDVSVRIERARWTESYQVEAGTLLATALSDLILDRWPGAQIGWDAVTVSDTLEAQAVFDLGDSSDPLGDARTLAEAHGYVLHADVNGVLRLRTPPDPATAAPIYTYAPGDTALLTSATRVAPMALVYNGVIVTGEGSGISTPVRGEAWDTDAASPTNIYGPYGKVPMFYSSSLITTEDQAANVAEAKLRGILGRVEQLSWEQVVNPALAPFDVVAVTDAASATRTYILDRVTTPPSPSGTQSAVARETTVAF